MTYNLVIIETKCPEAYLNLTEEEFFEKLWIWTYVDDLWDFIEEENPESEYLNEFIYRFIDENMFHGYEDDDTDCYAFVAYDNGTVHTYLWNEELVNFIYSKIEEHYDNKLVSNS